MKKVLIIIVLLVLAVSQFYLLRANNSLKIEITHKNRALDQQLTIYSALQPQFSLGVQNIGCIINDSTVVTDTLKKIDYLGNIIKDNTLIVRISDRYCKQCVDHAVSVLTDNKDDFDFSKVVFLSDTDNPRTFNLQIREYGLNSCNIYICGTIGLPIEQLMFPYYMVVDSSLKVVSVYAPSKPTHGTDFDFKNVKFMYECLVK